MALYGRIYTFRPLNGELVNRAHRCATAGDNDVIANVAEERAAVYLRGWW